MRDKFTKEPPESDEEHNGMHAMKRGVRHFDREAALERMGGDEQLLRDIAGLFVLECGELMTSLQAALEQRDAIRLERSAHNLKGSVANFGAQAAAEAAYAVERCGKAADFETARPALHRLANELDLLLPELEQLSRRR